MITRRRRSRRRRSWSSKLRHFLIEHRFNAAQGGLGLIALAVGLWLLWPPPPSAKVDHRGLWQRSLQLADERFAGADQAVRDGLLPVTEASKGVSAERGVEGVSESEPAKIAGVRLAQVARTMPAIGVPEGPQPAPEGAQPRPEGTEPPVRTADLALDRQGPGAQAPVSAATTALRATSAKPTVAQLLPHQALLPPDRRLAPAPTWLRNAVTPPIIDDRPEIAIMIDDLGLNRHNTAELNHLKGPLTLDFLPYATDLDAQTRAARAAGHELMVHVPMEPIGNDWPGPGALVSSLSPNQFLSRFRTQLRSFRGFVGINNHMGSLLTADRGAMDEIMTELKARGLLFVDSRTTSKSVAAAEAERLGVPHTERDIFLDNEIDLDSIRRQLTAVEHIARRRGVAVAIGHPHDVTIEALREWLPTVEERGFVLVPISTVVARESCAHGLLPASSSACGRYVSAHNMIQ
jgi:polysaccharide deacetylase 2 family uncharacterized protein YibQ